MQNIINNNLQEQMHDLVMTKLSFIEPNTFDRDEEKVDFAGRENVQWNLHHFIRSGKLCSNGFYSCKATLGYIYSISNDIVRSITSESKESYTRLESRLVQQKHRLENNIVELNMALAEYAMIFEDEFARSHIDSYYNETDKTVQQLADFAEDASKKGEATASYYLDMQFAKENMAIADIAMRWFSESLDARINPNKEVPNTKTKQPSLLKKIAKHTA